MRTSVPLYFYLLVLSSWLGMKIFPIFWDGGFGISCYYASHFCIRCLNPNFIVLLGFLWPKKNWVSILKFSNFGVFTSFFVPPYFLEIFWHDVGHGPRSSVLMLVRPLLHFYITLGCMLHLSSRVCFCFMWLWCCFSKLQCFLLYFPFTAWLDG